MARIEIKKDTKVFGFKIANNNRKGKFHQLEQVGREIVDKCSVDILIPFHGQYESVRKLVESILEKTRYTPYQITLIDDCSPNDAFIETMKKLTYINCIRTKEHLGFGNAINFGVQQTKQPYVCVIHSDCLIQTPNWLEALGESLLNLKDQKVRLVSAKSNNPVSDIKELLSESPMISKDIVATEFLSLFCFMFHRELFNRIGSGIKPYPYGLYEDEELFHRMNKFNFKQGISGSSWVYHKGGATIQALWQENLKSKKIMLEDNRSRCLADIKKL